MIFQTGKFCRPSISEPASHWYSTVQDGRDQARDVNAIRDASHALRKAHHALLHAFGFVLAGGGEGLDMYVGPFDGRGKAPNVYVFTDGAWQYFDVSCVGDATPTAETELGDDLWEILLLDAAARERNT